jgi:hypothetical protein
VSLELPLDQAVEQLPILGKEPTALARANNIPRPLMAECQKAMAPKPPDRYTTPLAVAKDQEHWLAVEPVSGYSCKTLRPRCSPRTATSMLRART